MSNEIGTTLWLIVLHEWQGCQQMSGCATWWPSATLCGSKAAADEHILLLNLGTSPRPGRVTNRNIRGPFRWTEVPGSVSVPRALVERAMESCKYNNDHAAWNALLWVLDPASFGGERLQHVEVFMSELEAARFAALQSSRKERGDV